MVSIIFTLLSLLFTKIQLSVYFCPPSSLHFWEGGYTTRSLCSFIRGKPRRRRRRGGENGCFPGEWALGMVISQCPVVRFTWWLVQSKSEWGSQWTVVVFLTLYSLTSLLPFLLVAWLQNISWYCKWQRHSPKRLKAKAKAHNNVLKEAFILIKKASGLRDRLTLCKIDLQT